MGQHLMHRAPKFVQGFIDRHGKPRFYFRRAGFKKVPLPGLPWSPEFMAAYEGALAGQPLQIGAARVKPGTIRALAVLYFGSVEFRTMKPISQATRRRVIERFCRDTDKLGGNIGDKSAVTLQREHVVKLMAARAERPESANALRKSLRAMMQHAVAIRLRADDPTRDVRPIRTKTQGHHTWTDEEMAQFEARHPVGSIARLAMALLVYTGQRPGDVSRMGRQHLRDGAIYLRQEKTGTELAIPIHPDLQQIIDATAAGRMTFIVTGAGKPFTPAGFGIWFKDKCFAANLPHCSAHGLRKAAARRLAEAGCTANEIAAITGHRSLREVARYTEAADQKRLAVAAIGKIKTGTPTV